MRIKDFISRFGKGWLALAALCALSACSTNPATGKQQFAALMSPAQENNVGAQEHRKIMAEYGNAYEGTALAAYVSGIGARLTQNTERGDVQYKFFVLDTPMVNAFALPGGYIYVTRGLLALANSEAELASVLAHEIGHITGRHSAERYSQGVLTSLGAAVLSAAADNNTASQALGLGAELYTKSYSRGQESEADDLGIRYLSRAGYDPRAMARFLSSLDHHSALESEIAGVNGQKSFSYFSTHPRTADRVQQAMAIAANYPPPPGGNTGDSYLQAIEGLVYGDNVQQGFARGRDFYHPGMGFAFSVPDGFRINNAPRQVIATGNGGAVILFDAAGNPQRLDPMTWTKNVWMKGEPLAGAESITINGMAAATASFPGKVNGQPMTVRIVAVAWSPDKMFRFQMAIPQNASADTIEGFKRTTYSLRPMTGEEKQSIRPWNIQIVTAGTTDTVATLARQQPFESLQAERFRVLNGLKGSEDTVPGKKYKLVSAR